MKLSVIFSLALLVPCAHSQESKYLESEMMRLDVHTALLMRSQSVDEFPVWSPDSRSLGVNIGGEWFKLDTRNVRLRKAKWHDQSIAVIAKKPELVPMSIDEAAEWGKRGQHGESDIEDRGGFKAEMRRRELSSSLEAFPGSAHHRDLEI